jgi:hypothetical protein
MGVHLFRGRREPAIACGCADFVIMAVAYGV